ncbi:MAG TPA: tRNA methyl transferase PRC-barrel domain-containing protein, partial [Candidatus Paceibacterota bacterium]
VCFIGKFSMIDFLKKYTRVKKGLAITKDGEVVGEHDGVYFYTIGQRHGFSKGGGASYYVVAKDIKKNLLIVADKADEKKFYKKEVHITGANWINSPPVEGKLYRARIRYRQPLQSCKVFAFKKKLYLLKDGRRGKSSRGKVFSSSCFVVFSKSQRAITPGQSLVLYNGKRMLGGGVIVK